MDPKLQVRVQRYGWDAASGYYEDGWRGPLAPAQRTLLEMAALQRDERVIEAAAGSGLVTKMIARIVGPSGEVMATDLSQNMVDLTARQCAAEGLDWVRTARVSADDLAVEEGHFDAALCALGLMYVPDPRLAIASMRRAVRSGGRVAATVGASARIAVGPRFSRSSTRGSNPRSVRCSMAAAPLERSTAISKRRPARYTGTPPARDAGIPERPGSVDRHADRRARGASCQAFHA